MKLKKAINIEINYPSRESIKPVLVGVGMTLAISACSQTVGQEPIIKDERRSKVVEESANVAGGMPVYIPPPKEKNASTVYKFKKFKEEIVPPRVTAGVPVPKSK